MKRILRLAAATIVLATGSAGAAETGVYVPVQFPDEPHVAVGLGVKHEIPLTDLLSVEARGEWMHMEGPVNIEAVAPEAGIIAHLAPDSEWAPYAGVGVGYFLLHATRGDVDNDVGWYMLAGVTREIEIDWRFFCEVRWLGLEADADADFAGTAGTGDKVKLSGPGANIGVSLRW